MHSFDRKSKAVESVGGTKAIEIFRNPPPIAQISQGRTGRKLSAIFSNISRSKLSEDFARIKSGDAAFLYCSVLVRERANADKRAKETTCGNLKEHLLGMRSL